MDEYYSILGLSPNASEKEIKKHIKTSIKTPPR
jgi:DnaJ-class molecular chaperone